MGIFESYDEKSTPTDADLVLIADSDDVNLITGNLETKKVTHLNLVKGVKATADQALSDAGDAQTDATQALSVAAGNSTKIGTPAGASNAADIAAHTVELAETIKRNVNNVGQIVSQQNLVASPGAAHLLNFNNGNVIKITLDSNLVLTVQNELPGGMYYLVFEQGGTGSYSVDFSALNVLWQTTENNDPPSFLTSVGSKDNVRLMFVDGEWIGHHDNTGVPVLDPGLILWNKLEDDTGVSEFGTNLIKTGSPTFSAAKYGLGQDDPANVANFMYIPRNVYEITEGTIEFWITFNQTGTVGTNRGIFGDRTNDGLFDIFDAAGTLILRITGANISVPVAGLIVSGSTVHFGITWDEVTDNRIWYIDGVSVGSNNSAPVTLSDGVGAGFIIGGKTDLTTNGSIDSVIDNIKVFNYAKTDFSDRHVE